MSMPIPMPLPLPLPRFSDPRLSLWQSAVADVLARHAGGNVDAAHADPLMIAASHAAVPFQGLAPGQSPPATTAASASASLRTFGAPAEVAALGHLNCAVLYLEAIFDDNPVQRQMAREQVAAFSGCDPRWAEALIEYEKNIVLQHQPVPYIPPRSSDFSVLDLLPETATIGLLADWGTGTSQARALLGRLAESRRPGVPFLLIHLGDIYYSGTEDEVNRFVSDCRDVLGPDVPVYTLSGNHDMYSGGAPYYRTIARLNASPFTQPASYFVLRNAHWQIQAMDTGLNDRDPWQVSADTTFLDPAEASWHRGQLASASAAGRKIVLLSHHQAFSAFMNIGNGFVNDRLLSVFDGRDPAGDRTNYLPSVVLWLWGHEHNTIVYEPSQGVARGRCIGSGAIPVAVSSDPYTPQTGTIPFDAKAILSNDGAVYSHGFAVMEIDGPSGKVHYYQSPDPKGRNPIFTDEFPG